MVAIGVAGCLACGESSVDAKTFEALRLSAQSMREDVKASHGAGTARSTGLLQALEAELAATETRVRGARERAALERYAEAAEGYRYFLRFRDLDRDAQGEMVLLRGSNRPVALRYGIPFQEKGGGRWVNRKTAMEMFAGRADAALAEAAALLSGTSSH